MPVQHGEPGLSATEKGRTAGRRGRIARGGAARVLVHLNHRHTNGQREEGAIMTHARVRDVMTTDVITVAGTTDYKEIAARLRASRVSAFPVLDDDGRVAGVVSAADLLAKVSEEDSGDRHPWFSGRRSPSAPANWSAQPRG
jgi:CBS domain-containing protein